MIETEAKIQLSKEELASINDILGTSCRDYVPQKNFIYSLPNGYLRARFEDQRAYLTFKGKRKEGLFNSRKELEFILSAEEKPLLSFLESLGFHDPFEYEKRRASFTLSGCVVSVDKLPNKDIYLEVEGKERNIADVLKTLKLDNKNIEGRSYDEILKKRK